MKTKTKKEASAEPDEGGGRTTAKRKEEASDEVPAGRVAALHNCNGVPKISPKL